MNRDIDHIKKSLMATFVVGAIAALPVVAQEPAPDLGGGISAEAEARMEVNLAFEQQMAAIKSDRAVVIDGIVAGWTATLEARGWDGDWQADLSGALNAASDLTLAAVADAGSYEEVQSILQGGGAGLEGVAGVETLGDTYADLVFTSVPPCRVFDTRKDWDGSTKPSGGPAGSQINYYVHGPASVLYGQGHNEGVNSGPGCVSPRGEPSAISANFTVADTEGNGHIRAWPYDSAMPNASFLNYNGTANLANSGIVATCFSCGYELSVATFFARAHSIADVMGYFYPVETDDVNTQTSHYTWDAYGVIPTNTCTSVGYVYIYAPADGYTSVTATSIWEYNETTDAERGQLNTYLSTTSGSCASNGTRALYVSPWTQTGESHYYPQLSNQTALEYQPAGTGGYYYLNAIQTGVGTANNWSSNLIATFHPAN